MGCVASARAAAEERLRLVVAKERAEAAVVLAEKEKAAAVLDAERDKATAALMAAERRGHLLGRFANNTKAAAGSMLHFHDEVSAPRMAAAVISAQTLDAAVCVMQVLVAAARSSNTSPSVPILTPRQYSMSRLKRDGTSAMTALRLRRSEN